MGVCVQPFTVFYCDKLIVPQRLGLGIKDFGIGGLGDETFWLDTLMRHFDETFYWDILMRHFEKTF